MFGITHFGRIRRFLRHVCDDTRSQYNSQSGALHSNLDPLNQLVDSRRVLQPQQVDDQEKQKNRRIEITCSPNPSSPDHRDLSLSAETPASNRTQHPEHVQVVTPPARKYSGPPVAPATITTREEALLMNREPVQSARIGQPSCFSYIDNMAQVSAGPWDTLPEWMAHATVYVGPGANSETDNYRQLKPFSNLTILTGLNVEIP